MARDILHLSPPSYHFFERIFREDNKHLDVPPCKEGGGLFTTVKRHGSASEICRIYLKRIEHVCFKFPEALEQRAGKRTHRADSHCGRDDGIRLDEGEGRLEQVCDTWGLGEPGGECVLHRLHLLRLRERPLRQNRVRLPRV